MRKIVALVKVGASPAFHPVFISDKSLNGVGVGGQAWNSVN